VSCAPPAAGAAARSINHHMRTSCPGRWQPPWRPPRTKAQGGKRLWPVVGNRRAADNEDGARGAALGVEQAEA
jgi:hypothetical protein